MKTIKSKYQSPRVGITNFAGVSALMIGSPETPTTVSYGPTVGGGGKSGD